MQGKTSHKFFDPNENFIMRLYYQKDVLTFMCFCNEMFYSGLYLLHFTTGPTCEWLFRTFNWVDSMQPRMIVDSRRLLVPFPHPSGSSICDDPYERESSTHYVYASDD